MSKVILLSEVSRCMIEQCRTIENHGNPCSNTSCISEVFQLALNSMAIAMQYVQ